MRLDAFQQGFPPGTLLTVYEDPASYTARLHAKVGAREESVEISLRDFRLNPRDAIAGAKDILLHKFIPGVCFEEIVLDAG